MQCMLACVLPHAQCTHPTQHAQTEKYQPPALLEGGRLPINEHGNIEVLGGTRAFLPAGA